MGLTYFVLGLLTSFALSFASDPRCTNSITTAYGRSINKNSFCSGELIFEDNFNNLDESKWQHEVTLGGGGNWEFQWYVNDRRNSYTNNGALNIKPTLTSDIYGESFLSSGTIKLGAECTNSMFYGCERVGTSTNLLNPIRSARIRTLGSFNFKYGRVEVRAKLPAGDWLWPAIWMLPSRDVYGSWPRSGEIDIMESRGNRNLVINGGRIGAEQVGSTLHFGPAPEANAWPSAHYVRNSPEGQGFNLNFHRYQLEWSPDRLVFKLDDREIGTVQVGSGFWERGAFARNGWRDNIWARGGKSAPFDQEFHLIINLAVGGMNYFPDAAWNPDGKPWSNSSPNGPLDFWKGRNAWLKTWNYYVPGNTDRNFQIDYVRVWAL